jgi:NAD(P)-dependent dehydrogenase (short-subunit alcohol dehydrogenase family)
MLLEDKVIIITGVGPGMGRKLATIAAVEGAKVALSARSEGLINEVAAEIRAAGGHAIAERCDVGHTDQCERLAAATLEAFGRIDGLINSAYRFSHGRKLEDNDLGEWQATMDASCWGALRMIKAVLPAMKRQGGGSIVNVSSRSTVQIVPGEGAYVVAKEAIHGATRFLAVELGPYNIRVNAPRMGWLWGVPVENHLKHRAETTGVPFDEIVAGIAKEIPLGVIPPDEECAKSVLFFVSDYSKMVTGTSMDINGGQFMAA